MIGYNASPTIAISFILAVGRYTDGLTLSRQSMVALKYTTAVSPPWRPDPRRNTRLSMDNNELSVFTVEP